MTARVVLACDGMEGMFRCRQAVPVGEVQTGREARRLAKEGSGWSTRYQAREEYGWEYRVVDLCPRCTKAWEES